MKKNESNEPKADKPKPKIIKTVCCDAMVKCKGTGKAKGFGCGDMSDKRNYGLCPKCKYEWATSTEEGKEWFEKQTAYKRKANEKVVRAEKREEKALTNDWSKLLQTEINKIIRLIDKGLPCLARKKFGQIHAGHIYSRGSNQTIKYNLHNIHRQNAQSNHFQNDDGLLREGLIKEYGQDYRNFISELRRTPSLEYSNVEYRELTTNARSIVRRLENEDRIYSKLERLEMRNRINLELNIYNPEYCEFNT